MPESRASKSSDNSEIKLVKNEKGKYFYESTDTDGVKNSRQLGYTELISEHYHSFVLAKIARMNRTVREATIGRIERSLENIRDVIADLMTGRRRTQEFFKEDEPDWLPTPGTLSKKTVPSKLDIVRRNMKEKLGTQYSSRGSDEEAIQNTAAYFAAIREKNAQAQKNK